MTPFLSKSVSHLYGTHVRMQIGVREGTEPYAGPTDRKGFRKERTASEKGNQSLKFSKRLQICLVLKYDCLQYFLRLLIAHKIWS